MQAWTHVLFGWLCLAVLVGCLWVFRLWRIGRALGSRLILSPEGYSGPPTPAPRVCAVVAAHNEEHNIEPCLRSLLCQDYPNLEIVVVDDRSTDRTSDLLDRCRAESAPLQGVPCGDAANLRTVLLPPLTVRRSAGSRPHAVGCSSVAHSLSAVDDVRGAAAPTQRGLQVRRVETVPDGWSGKSHAMHCGVTGTESDPLRGGSWVRTRSGFMGGPGPQQTRYAGSEWLLFTDADCCFTSPATVSIAMHEALAQEVNLLSIFPKLEYPTCWERVLQPAAVLTLLAHFRPARCNDPADGTAYANGAFILMDRKTYRAIGGHAAVKEQLNEDIALARLVKRAGGRLCVAENEGLYRVRMYASPSDAWRGWTRIFLGCLQGSGQLIQGTVGVALMSLAPPVSMIAALAGLCLDAQARFVYGALLLAWALAAVLGQLAMWRLYRVLGVHPAWSLAHGLGALVTCFMLNAALLQRWGVSTTAWRGMVYRRGRPVGVDEEAIAVPRRGGVPFSAAETRQP